jgi:hypothetical protein
MKCDKCGAKMFVVSRLDLTTLKPVNHFARCSKCDYKEESN